MFWIVDKECDFNTVQILLLFPIDKSIEELTNLLEQLNVMINTNLTVFPDQVEPNLAGFLDGLRTISIQDDRLREQHQNFLANWEKLQERFQFASEHFKINNLGMWQEISIRANDLLKKFDKEIERTLVDEPEEQERQESENESFAQSWANMCEELEDEPQPNLMVKVPLSLLQTGQFENVSPVHLEPAPEQMQVQMNEQMQEHLQVQLKEPETKDVQANTLQLAAENIATQPSEVVTPEQKSNEKTPSAFSEKVKSHLAIAADHLNKIKPHSVEHSRSGSPVSVVTNNTIPMSLERPGEYSYQMLKNYDLMAKKLQNVPKVTTPATAKQFQNLNTFLGQCVIFSNQNHMKWSSLEPMVMSQVVMSLPPLMKQNWAIQTAVGGTFLHLRAFMSNWETLTRQGFIAEIEDDVKQPLKQNEPTTPVLEQSQQSETKVTKSEPPNQQTYAQMAAKSLGAIPKVKKPNDDWDESTFSPPKSTRRANSTHTEVSNWADGQSASSHCYDSDNRPQERRSNPRFQPSHMQSPMNDKHNKRGGNFQAPGAKKAREDSASTNTKPMGMMCLGCLSNDHVLFKCQSYLELSLPDRWNVVRNKGICPLCLIDYHKVILCPKQPCKRCHPPKQHNSTLCGNGYQTRNEH